MGKEGGDKGREGRGKEERKMRWGVGGGEGGERR